MVHKTLVYMYHRVEFAYTRYITYNWFFFSLTLFTQPSGGYDVQVYLGPREAQTNFDIVAVVLFEFTPTLKPASARSRNEKKWTSIYYITILLYLIWPSSCTPWSPFGCWNRKQNNVRKEVHLFIYRPQAHSMWRFTNYLRIVAKNEHNQNLVSILL